MFYRHAVDNYVPAPPVPVSESVIVCHVIKLDGSIDVSPTDWTVAALPSLAARRAVAPVNPSQS